MKPTIVQWAAIIIFTVLFWDNLWLGWAICGLILGFCLPKELQ